jgi:hypothetical protein
VSGSATSLPASVSILQSIVTHLGDAQPLFKKNNPLQVQFLAFLNTEKDLIELPSFVSSPESVTFIQLMLLTALSLLDGLENTHIKWISTKGKTVTIQWKNKMSSSFTFGKIDQSYKQFQSYFFNKVFSKTKQNAQLNRDFIASLVHLFQKYSNDLEASINRINILTQNPVQMISSIGENKDLDLFFIILSSLPSEQLNALYLHIQQFFPANMELKTSKGQMVNLKGFFQIPSQDIRFLIDKIKMHFNLFFYSDAKEVRAKIQQETLSFLKILLTNTSYFTETVENITNTRDNFLATQLSLYTLFCTTLQRYV